MKHTFKKFTAALAAAVMCALPTVNALSANAYANDNARYTFRKTYIVTRSSDIDAISFSWNINSNGNSAPQVTTLVPGEFMNGGTGVINHHIGAGSFFPTNPNVTGPVFTQSFISNTNTPTVYGNSVSVFKTNGQIDNSAIVVTDKFLVGDLDKDGDIDAADREIVRRASYSNLTSYTDTTYVYLNSTQRYLAYQLDINDDGKVNTADYNMIYQYVRGANYLLRFPK
ncbi:MAG: hypothetical protein IKH96_01460 [Ruminococcus sp.]|uniref:hypothetical protein n=1 Tax=Ruminococcus sp. TaxID=41978 RepID=UPI0025F8ECAC|nr:hypothetical protein [Ruminococcus sp.]MBR6994665.1 hypothetical protein [Ruminococcus sp.]